MKKLIISLLCAIILCLTLQPAVLAASESIEIELNGQPLTLMFDRSEQFSNVSGGNVQASFYTYLDDTNDLYELYMIFPEDVQPGTTIDPEYALAHAPETSVVLIVTSGSSVDYYFAGQAEDTDGSDYAMTFDSVTDSGSDRTYSGTLSASMIGMSAETESEISPISIQNARFSFTMPLSGGDGDDYIPYDTPPEDEPFDDAPYVNPSPTREVYRV